jgi:protein gp37
VSGLLIRADRGEKVLRSVGEAPNGIVCIVVPDGTAAWAIDAAWQPPTVASLEHGGVITVDMPSENGMGQASTVVDVDDIVVACASGWTGATWNPVTGCDRISPGCDHCYALALAARLKRMGQARYQRDGDPRTSGPGFGLTLHEDKVSEPLGWRRPRVVFVNSMSDLFHKDVPVDFIERVFVTMAEHAAAHLPGADEAPEADGARREQHLRRVGGAARPRRDGAAGERVARHVDRERRLRLARRSPARAPAAVRFISAEPLLGPLPSLDLAGIDWLIAGGESGPDHRPLDPGWVRDLRDRCAAAGVAFFFKQVGGARRRAAGACSTAGRGMSSRPRRSRWRRADRCRRHRGRSCWRPSRAARRAVLPRRRERDRPRGRRRAPLRLRL